MVQLRHHAASLRYSQRRSYRVVRWLLVALAVAVLVATIELLFT